MLITRDVLGWRVKEVGELLDIAVAAVNSHLQRARGAIAEHLSAQRAEWPAAEDASAAERALVQTLVDASERGDVEALAATLSDDVRFPMPPYPDVWVGREDVVGSWTAGGFGGPDWGELRCVVTRANRQTAAANSCARRGRRNFKALALDVLRFADGWVAEIVTFDAGRVRHLRAAGDAVIGTVTLAPGTARAYVDGEWAGALVVLVRGRLELEARDGRRVHLRSGAVLWLAGLPLRALHSRAGGPAVPRRDARGRARTRRRRCRPERPAGGRRRRDRGMRGGRRESPSA